MKFGSYTFRDPSLAQQALTHRSAVRDHRLCNEKLEWLGDSILSATVTLALVQRFPQASEAELAPARIEAIRNETLAGVARELGLVDRILAHEGLIKRLDASPQVLADTVEALLGAIALDGGFQAAEKAIGDWLAPFWASLGKQGEGLGELQEARTRLQKHLNTLASRPRARYRVLSGGGGEEYHAECRVSIQDVDEPITLTTDAKGRSKRLAIREAAEKMLSALEEFELA